MICLQGRLGSLSLRHVLAGSQSLPVICSRMFSAEGNDDSETLTVQVNPFKAHRIEPPESSVSTSKSELLKFFEDMYRMRRMEISADMLYKAKLIRGFCHLYDGQEAVAVGMHAVLTQEDSIITSYRDHAFHLCRGGTVKEVIAELLGRVDGAAKGKGGSMHMYNRSHNFFGGQGIVGAQVPLGGGLAFAHQYLEDGSVGVALYGDGAANQGQLFETFNMAALWSLPCIFICENNHYGMGTAEWRAAKSPSFFSRGDYMPGLKVDGMDVLAVKKAVDFARKYVLESGPIILEMDTYRYHGHSMSDPGSTYRTRDEVSSMRQQRDPVEHVRKLLLDHGMAQASDLKVIEKAIKKEIDTAVEDSKAAATPPMEAMWQHVYATPTEGALRGVDATVLMPTK